MCLIAVGAFCMMSRWLNSIDPEIKLLPAFLLSHITNFAICMMALLLFGFVVLCFGGRLRIVSIAALLIAVLGIIYECLLPFLNTPDIWDAVFGVAGTAVAYIYLIILKKEWLDRKVDNFQFDEMTNPLSAPSDCFSIG